MLKNDYEYDTSLEFFSIPLLSVVDYRLYIKGKMSIKNETSIWYLTKQTESLYQFVKQTIEEELTKELQFIFNYDKTKKAIQEIVDMPNRQIDLFIRFVTQNGGKLSLKKRKKYFDFLSDREIEMLEEIIT